MISLLNPISLLLGLIAWILPIVNLIQKKKSENRNWITLSIISMSTCTISLCLQILYTNHLVNISDWTAIMDTMNYLAFIAILLVVVTMILNVITLFAYHDRELK